MYSSVNHVQQQTAGDAAAAAAAAVTSAYSDMIRMQQRLWTVSVM